MKWPIIPGEIPVVVNQYLPPGTVVLFSGAIDYTPPKFIPVPPVDLVDAFVYRAYTEMRLPDPRKFIALENILEAEKDVDRRWKRRERKLVSIKTRAKAQRRLDWRSNVRRRKRTAELERRKARR